MWVHQGFFVQCAESLSLLLVELGILSIIIVSGYWRWRTASAVSRCQPLVVSAVRACRCHGCPLVAHLGICPTRGSRVRLVRGCGVCLSVPCLQVQVHFGVCFAVITACCVCVASQPFAFASCSLFVVSLVGYHVRLVRSCGVSRSFFRIRKSPALVADFCSSRRWC